MNRIVLIFLFALMFPVSAAWGASAKNLSASDSWRLIQKQENLFVLDVRTLQEYMQARISGATLIPIDQIVRRLKEIPADQPVLVYCAVGSRSGQVAGFLAQKGYGPVYNMYGGIWSWQSRGLPVLNGMP